MKRGRLKEWLILGRNILGYAQIYCKTKVKMGCTFGGFKKHKCEAYNWIKSLTLILMSKLL